MKKTIIITSFLSSMFTYSQAIQTTTEDGRKVLLNPDKTWSFTTVESEKLHCNIPLNFVEPKSEKYDYLKPFDATIDDLRSHIAVENEVLESDVIFLRFTEQGGNGMYLACVKGIKMKYRRTGSAFYKNYEGLTRF